MSRVWSCASLHVEVLNDLVETVETETAATVAALLPHNARLSASFRLFRWILRSPSGKAVKLKFISQNCYHS